MIQDTVTVTMEDEYAIYRMVPFSVTLNDQPTFQDLANIRRKIFQYIDAR